MAPFTARLLLLVSLLGLCASAPAQDAVDTVNPLIGTGRGKIGYGGTMPFVTAPFGMTNWTRKPARTG